MNDETDKVLALEAEVIKLQAENLKLKEKLELKRELIYWPSDGVGRILTRGFAFTNREALDTWEVDYRRISGFENSVLHQISRVKLLDDWSYHLSDLPF